VRELSLEDRFTFLGSLSHAEALAALSSARCMVLPSLWEGLPMAVIEAMHLGLPVIATDMPGLREMVLEGETGHLVASGDAKGFADRLSAVVADGPGRAVMQQAARRRASVLFSLTQQIDQHVSLYRSMAMRRDLSGIGSFPEFAA
jgi:glycosyltransferase involved in cell wall biosynthesis